MIFKRFEQRIGKTEIQAVLDTMIDLEMEQCVCGRGSFHVSAAQTFT